MVRERGWAAHYIIPLCLTACFLILSRFFMGLSLADNTVEIIHGGMVGRYTFVKFQAWSPLYSLWLHTLAYIVPDPLVRYFFSWGFVASALALIPTVMRTPSAWIYNFLIVVCPFLIIEPFIGQFASAMLVLSLCVFLRRDRSILFALVMACCVSFVVAYVRPEFDYAVLLSAAGTLGWFAVEYARRNGGGRSFPAGAQRRALVLVALVVSLCGVLLFTMVHSKAARSGIAISQHYNLRAVERGEMPAQGEFWNSDYAAHAFGVDPARVHNDTATLAEFIRGNPPLYFRFMLQNLLQLKTILLLTCWCLVLLWPFLQATYSRLRPASVFLMLLTLAPLSGVVLVSPRWHYVVVIAPCLILFALQMLKPERWVRPSMPIAIACGCLLIWAVELRVMPELNESFAPERRDLQRVECARSADQDEPGAQRFVFDATGVGDTYLRHRRTLVTAATLVQWPQFQRWAAATHPAWIATDESLPAQYGISATQLDGFLQGELRYRAQHCNGGAATLYSSHDPGSQSSPSP